jgi:hypothetical protein
MILFFLNKCLLKYVSYQTFIFYYIVTHRQYYYYVILYYEIFHIYAVDNITKYASLHNINFKKT